MTKGLVVYVPMSADILHPGHINILKKAHELGYVVVGLGSDERIRHNKGRLPAMSFEDRKVVVEALRYVDEVIEKKSLKYVDEIRVLQPDIVLHGDDWSEEARAHVEAALGEYGGKLVEVDYNEYPLSSSQIKQRIREGI